MVLDVRSSIQKQSTEIRFVQFQQLQVQIIQKIKPARCGPDLRKIALDQAFLLCRLQRVLQHGERQPGALGELSEGKAVF